MLDILAITSPIYITILIGFVATRFGWFDKAAMRNFGAFVIKLALPALLFRAVGQRQIGEILNVSYLFAYAGGSLVLLGLSYVCCRRLAGLGQSASAIYAMGMTCSNSGFIGYPILLLTFAPVAGVALALNVIVENVLVLPLLLALAERGRGGDTGPWYKLAAKSFAQLARNPIVIGTAAGLVVSLLGWKLPGPAERTVAMFAVSSSALSLFVIGGTLVGLPIGRLARRPRRSPSSSWSAIRSPCWRECWPCRYWGCRRSIRCWRWRRCCWRRCRWRRSIRSCHRPTATKTSARPPW
jgi:malonate transporter